jgi:hypothetical protein
LPAPARWLVMMETLTGMGLQINPERLKSPLLE